MDSIRECRTKEDIISTIQMEFSSDFHNEKAVVLVEGSDDIKFVHKVFRDDVIAMESFSGKEGLKELMEDSYIQENNVISIRDRDYMDAAQLLNGMFVYDKCCLELMLLSSKEVAESLRIHYQGNKKESFIIDAMRMLAPYSILRKKNELENRGINFRAGFGDLVKSEEQFQIEKLFQRVGQDESVFYECSREASETSDEVLWDITNGHDICLYLGCLSKITDGNLGEEGVRKFILSAFRKSDFAETELHQNISCYQQARNVHYID